MRAVRHTDRHGQTDIQKHAHRNTSHLCRGEVTVNVLQSISAQVTVITTSNECLAAGENTRLKKDTYSVNIAHMIGAVYFR